MAYTETKSVSWFNRLGSSFRGILVGLGLIAAGTMLLWWNEGNFVATGDALTEAQGQTRELGDINTLDSSKNGQLVHAVGPTETKDILKDSIFGVEVNALRLERRVEYYQWVEETSTETRQKLGGEEETVTVYTYKQQWVRNPVDSSQFKDPEARRRQNNFVLMAVPDFKVQAADVSFGAYRLPEFLVNSIGGAEPLEILLTEEAADSLNRQTLEAARAVLGPESRSLSLAAPDSVAEAEDVNEATAETPVPETPAADEKAAENTEAGPPAEPGEINRPAPEKDRQVVHISGNTIFVGLSPNWPRTGDLRVTFMATRPATVSLLAKVNGNTFEPYQAANGKAVSKISLGSHSLENMYGAAHSSNAAMTWILRFIGAFLVFFGLKMVVAPLEVLAGVVPVLGSLVGVGTGLVAGLLGLAWSLTVIAVAWLRFRPVIGAVMLAAAGGLIVLLYLKGRSRKAARTQ